MQSSLICRNVIINGRRTSIRLEQELWTALALICHYQGKNLHQVCSDIDREKTFPSFTSAVRSYVIRHLLLYHRIPGSAA